MTSGTSTSSFGQITTGFVFIDGQYLEAPYTVDRLAYDARINGIVVAHHEPPLTGSRFAGVQMGRLAAAGKNTTGKEFFDGDGGHPALVQEVDAHWEKIRTENPYQEAYAKLKALLQSAKFISVVETDEENPEFVCYRVVLYDGSSCYLEFVMKPDENDPPHPEGLVRRDLSWIMKNLQRGECIFYGTQPPRHKTLGPRLARDMLPEAIRVLSSDMTHEDKVKSLARVLDPRKRETADDYYVSWAREWVGGYKKSPGLERRIREIAEGRSD